VKKFKLLASFSLNQEAEAKAEWRHLARVIVKNNQTNMSVQLSREPDGWHIYLYMRTE